jgi:predicted dehydrogenase
MPTVKLVTLSPGHFHAALVQKEMLRGVDPHAHVYGPLDSDLISHLGHIARFNARPNDPMNWTLNVHAGPDWLDRFLAERPGNAVVIAGRNRPKIDLILAAVSAGCCVLADKPWIVGAADFPKLERVFAEADRNGVFAWDIMTERFEETTVIQRDLIHDPDVFGEPLPGTPDEPALELESVHYLFKQVAGVPLRRPAWWFDPDVAGEAMADVGTHLVDLAIWLLFPSQAVDYRKDIEIIAADRWPTCVELEDFCQITGVREIPAELAHLRDGTGLTYWGNGSATIRIRGHVVRFTTRWGVRPDGPDGDTHFAVARGSRSLVVVEHAPDFGPGPQVFVVPEARHRDDVLAACRAHRRSNDSGDRIHLPVADSERRGHEAHFAEVLSEFVRHFRDRSAIPAWERPNLLAKYFITTQAVELARAVANGRPNPS